MYQTGQFGNIRFANALQMSQSMPMDLFSLVRSTSQNSGCLRCTQKTVFGDSTGDQMIKPALAED
jgi:hypothetical protein